MNTNRLLRHVPRRVMNAAIVAGGIAGIVLQSRFGWDILTTFLITLGLCLLSVGIVSVVYRTRSQG